ncbi:MAG: DUF488 family protein [Terriglobia bacterium]
MRLYTIGFTKKTARQFFEILKGAGVKKLIDIRLNNRSQLAGFTKKEDLEYFLQTICGVSYHHLPLLAPTQEILDDLKKHKGTWSQYEERFQALMRERGAIEKADKAFFHEPCCLLCSEATPEHCHRRIVAEALKRRWPDVEIAHL